MNVPASRKGDVGVLGDFVPLGPGGPKSSRVVTACSTVPFSEGKRNLQEKACAAAVPVKAGNLIDSAVQQVPAGKAIPFTVRYLCVINGDAYLKVTINFGGGYAPLTFGYKSCDQTPGLSIGTSELSAISASADGVAGRRARSGRRTM